MGAERLDLRSDRRPAPPGDHVTVSSDYWLSTFGIASEAEFLETVGTWMPQYAVWGVGWDRETVARFAYHNAWSPPGLTATEIATVRSLFGSDPVKLKAVGDSGGNYWDNLVSAGQQFVLGVAMPALIVPDTGLVSIEMQSGGQDVVNVVGVDLTGGSIAAATAAVKVAWEIAAGPLTRLNNLTALVNYHGMDLSSSTGAIVDVASAAVGGAGATAKATNGACALVKWNGGTRSKSQRGRLYLGPLAEGDVNSDGRTLVAGSLAGFQTAFTNFRNSLSGAGFPLVIVSRLLQEATPVVSHSVESVIATQRRRIR